MYFIAGYYGTVLTQPIGWLFLWQIFQSTGQTVSALKKYNQI
jgi:hypothetical protein